MTTPEELGHTIHSAMCGSDTCGRYRKDNPHYDYYQDSASRLFGQLEPVIGSANVSVVVSAVLEELI